MNLLVGETTDGTPLHLSSRDLQTHVHGVGASRKGKSKLIEWITREFIKGDAGLCLIDPHGHLYDDLLRWLAYMNPRRREIILFNPSYEEHIVGFNPFYLAGVKDEARIATKADRMVAATLRAWGATDANNAPRLERWLRCLYYVLIEQDLSVDAARYFLSAEHAATREAIISGIRSPVIREQWQSLVHAKSEHGYLAQLESTGNRLFKFITHPTIRRVLGLPENSIDLEDIAGNKKVLLVNLQPSEVLSEEAARVIGTLLLNELWEVIRRRKAPYGKKPTPFYVVIDEFQNFATPDVPTMLDEGAKYGLHLLLFHQRLSQLDTNLHGSMKNAHTRFIFGGLPRLDVAHLLEGSIPSYEAQRDPNMSDADNAMYHPQQQYTLRRPEQPLVTATAPVVRDWYVNADKVSSYQREKTAMFLTPADVDEQLTRLFKSRQLTPTAIHEAESSRTQIFNNAAEVSDEDLFE